MAYVAYPEGTLWKSKPDGTERAQLTFPPIHALLPRWSPDGKRIAFTDVVSNDYSRSERFLSLKGISRPPDIDAYVGLAPDDSVLVLRSAAAPEIYALDWEAP